MTLTNLTKQLRKGFPENQARLLAHVIIENREEAQKELVKIKDFSELKEIVKRLAEAQERLTEAQERTEKKVEELAEAQKSTDNKMGELAEAQKNLAEAQKKTEEVVQELVQEMKDTRRELGGLGRSVGYSLENESFRALPDFLQDHYGIELTERLIRVEIEGKEINILGKGKKDGNEVIVVGEATLRLDTRNKFAQLQESVELVAKQYPGVAIIPIIITHYATQNVLRTAQERGVIVIQSFEWA